MRTRAAIVTLLVMYLLKFAEGDSSPPPITVPTVQNIINTTYTLPYALTTVNLCNQTSLPSWMTFTPPTTLLFTAPPISANGSYLVCTNFTYSGDPYSTSFTVIVGNTAPTLASALVD